MANVRDSTSHGNTLNHSKVSKVIILVIIGLVVFTFVLYGTAPVQKHEYREIGCVHSVCVENPVIGKSCLILEQKVSEITIVKNVLRTGTVDVLVVPSETRCN